jgi:hypothetical protein
MPKDTSCAICLRPRARVQRTRLPCAHLFHARCLDFWFARRARDQATPSCPLCRCYMPPRHASCPECAARPFTLPCPCGVYWVEYTHSNGTACVVHVSEQ